MRVRSIRQFLFLPNRAAIAAIVVAAVASPAMAFVPPFAAPEGLVSEAMLKACPAVPAPLTSLPTESRYRPDDPTRSEVDPERSKAYEAAVQPIRDFQGEIVNWANSYFGRPEKKADDAACALGWMHAWAVREALVSLPPGEGQFNRDQAFAGLGLAYLQLASVDVATDSAMKPAIVGWLHRSAEDTKVHYDTRAGRVSRANNHRYFAALAVAVAAIAADDKDLFAWAMKTYETAVCSASPDGSLPLEMARGSRAQEYQIFATGPLILLAEIGDKNGIDTYRLCDGAIHRIVRFGLASLDDPGKIEKLAGVKQKDVGELKGYRLAWLAPYLKRAPDSYWQAKIGGIGKLKSTSLGGDLSLLFDF